MTPKDVEVKKNDVVADVKDKIKSTPAPFIELDANAVDMYMSQKKSENTLEVKEGAAKKKSDEMEVDNDAKDEKKIESNPKVRMDLDETEDFSLVLEDTVVETEKINTRTTPPKTEKPPATILSRTPRRVALITLSSPKRAKAE